MHQAHTSNETLGELKSKFEGPNAERNIEIREIKVMYKSIERVQKGNEIRDACA